MHATLSQTPFSGATPALFAASAHLHSAGPLEVRLATSEQEIAAAQALRYRIFHQEMGAYASDAARRLGRDIDAYDDHCDHLLVIDRRETRQPHVVGTYRLLRQDVAAIYSGFYSEGEFDLSALIESAAGRGQLLELGRSCVAAEWRTHATISLLWRGIASYLRLHGVSHMFGCASLHGAELRAHAAELSYLHHHHLAPAGLRATATCRADVDLLAPGSYDVRAAQRALPPLVKGYLRVGAMVGDGAFVDRQFNTVDMFVVMPVEAITSRYLDRFAGNESA